MNTLIMLVVSAVVVYLAYTLYARRIDKTVLQADGKKATPARLYMDGVDFNPTSRNILYGYQFKSIAAAGPIVGAITAATFWGWLPALLWLLIGVSLIGWVQDYSVMMMAVRRDGDSISALAHRLVSPRARNLLLLFLFFYLLLIAGAFGNMLAGAIGGNPNVPLGLIMLCVAGVIGGQMLYKMKMDIVLTTVVIVGRWMGCSVLSRASTPRLTTSTGERRLSPSLTRLPVRMCP
jgi:carbon starvation protein